MGIRGLPLGGKSQDAEGHAFIPNDREIFCDLAQLKSCFLKVGES